MPVHQLYRLHNANCPVCQKEYRFQPTNNQSGALTRLRDAIHELSMNTDNFDLEFVIPKTASETK